jgi:hypothetical protein
MLVVLLVASLTSTAPVSLKDAVARIRDLPTVTSLRTASAMHAGTADNVSRWPGLQAEVLPGARLTTTDGANPAVQATVVVPFALADIAGARRGVATADAASARARADAETWRIEHAVIDAWHNRLASQARVDALQRAVAVAQEELQQLRGAQTLRAATSLDVVEQQAHVAELLLEELDAEGENTDAGLALARLLLLDGEVDVAETDTVLPAMMPATAVTGAQSAAIASVDAARADDATATAPVLGVGGAAQIDDDTTGFAYGRITLSLPDASANDLPAAARNEAMSEARAALTVAQSDFVNLKHLLSHEEEHSQEVFGVLSAHALPAAQERVSLLTARRSLSDVNASELLRAKRQLIQTEVRTQVARIAAKKFALLARHAGVDVVHKDLHK